MIADSHPSPRSSLRLRLAVLGAFAATALHTSPAAAQIAGTQNAQLPNVMLLVDTSGSMERMANGSMPTCTPGQYNPPNRWGSLVQSLTGSFLPYFSCSAELRTSQAFRTQYAGDWYGGTQLPLDWGYSLPYHRPLTGDANGKCAILPNWRVSGGLSSATPRDNALASLWPNQSGGYDACTFQQTTDGQLDIASPFVRFGLMTFDSELSPDLQSRGGWSYYMGSPAEGNLKDCPTVQNEVGARSTLAPEWEGPLIPFPPVDASAEQLASHNLRIQRALAAIRPYGATPLDGLMNDARTFFLNDPQGPFKSDVYVPGCRDQYIIVLSDGAPNLDLRKECEAGGRCPYPDTAKHVAAELANRDGGKVKTFVIGFAVSGDVNATNEFPDQARTCKQWYEAATAAQTTTSGKAEAFANACATLNPGPGTAARACCVLNELSVNGNGSPAYFAETQSELSAAFASILGQVIKSDSTRTVPVYANVSEVDGRTSSFFASFQPSATEPWAGELERQRLVCEAGVRKPQEIRANEGDSYATNLSGQNRAGQRHFLLAAPVGSNDAAGSLRRPEVAELGDFNATPLQERFVSNALDGLTAGFMTPTMLSVTDNDCTRSIDNAGALIPNLDAAGCARVALGFATASLGSMTLTGSGATQGITYDFSKYRCPQGGDCRALGAILRAQPAFSPAPVEPLRDDSYQLFASRQAPGYGMRPSVLYVATTDGLLHAFSTAGGIGEGTHNELWSFIPPAMLPHLKRNLPRGSQVLLDGSPAVKDVVFARGQNDVSTEALTTTGATRWHTALVAGFGEQQRGFYALDVTNPGPGSFSTATGTGDGTWAPTLTEGGSGRMNGPHMLWQLTDFPEPAQGATRGTLTRTVGTVRYSSMFGRKTPKPVITTLFFDPTANGGNAERSKAQEIAVAILAGGVDEGEARSQDCLRQVESARNEPRFKKSPPGYPHRSHVRSWSGSGCDGAVAGRSLTIVRLDNGEVLRVFGRPQDVPTALQGRLIDSPLDSPMSGAPVVYPGGLGAIGQKVVVGDADGTAWSFDLSSLDSSQWSAALLFDTQSGALTRTSSSAGQAYAYGQPLVVTPVMATTERGELMVGLATGEQETFSEPRGTQNYVFSLTESATCIGEGGTAELCTKLNWYLPLSGAERVTGPMTIFDSVFYFATFSPPDTNLGCGQGAAYLYGVDFHQAKNLTQLAEGGIARLPKADNPAEFEQRQLQGSEIIPGVTIRSMPACSDLTLAEYAAGGAGVFSPGSYQLVLPSARPSSGASGTNPNTRAEVVVQTLKTTLTPTQIDSFAAIVE